MTTHNTFDFWSPLSSVLGFVTVYLTSLHWALSLGTVEGILKDMVLLLSMTSLIITIYNSLFRKQKE